MAAALERSLAASAACAADDVVRTVHVLLDEGGGATAAARHIGGSDGLVGLLACIEGSPPVFRRFARDVLALKHGFGRAPAPELRVLVELALVLLQQAQGGGAAEGGGGGGLSCVRLLLLQRDPAAGAALAQVRCDMGGARRALASHCSPPPLLIHPPPRPPLSWSLCGHWRRGTATPSPLPAPRHGPSSASLRPSSSWTALLWARRRSQASSAC